MRNPFVGVVPKGGEFGAPRPGFKHQGIDISATDGKAGGKVFAAFAGTVEEVATDQVPGDMTSGRAPGRTGNGARVRNRDREQQIYNHMMPIVKEGDFVAEGQLIGHLDRSGQQTAPHLHFEVWDKNGTARDPRIDFKHFGLTPGKDAAPAAGPATTFLPLAADGKFQHRTITELQRALARLGLYRGVIEADHGRQAVAGPVLFTAYERFLEARGFDVGTVDGRFTASAIKAEQAWLHKQGFYKPTPPDGERGEVTITALQRALNARALK